MANSLVSISVVSHGQMGLVSSLLADIQTYCATVSLEVILTLNVPEVMTVDTQGYGFPILVVANPVSKGFGANHNQALKQARGDVFCIVNPDIRFDSNPFPALLACFDKPEVGIVAPMVFGPDGTPEDSARLFPTPGKILRKALGQLPAHDYGVPPDNLSVDWVGGMFMLIPRKVFVSLGGFDERYFLYYEDVDLCARLSLLGSKIVLCPHSHVVHHAQRTSHRQLKYLRWHVSSMVRFFCSAGFWKLRRLGRL